MKTQKTKQTQLCPQPNTQQLVTHIGWPTACCGFRRSLERGNPQLCCGTCPPLHHLHEKTKQTPFGLEQHTKQLLTHMGRPTTKPPSEEALLLPVTITTPSRASFPRTRESMPFATLLDSCFRRNDPWRHRCSTFTLFQHAAGLWLQWGQSAREFSLVTGKPVSYHNPSLMKLGKT